MSIQGTTRLLGLIGNPVRHTLSPLIHNMLAEQCGCDTVYTPLQVEQSGLLQDAVRGAHALNILGMNVTVPYKQDIMPYLCEIDPVAKSIGAVNTLVRTPEGYKGYNTDYIGLRMALEVNGIDPAAQDAVLIGAGGAARAAGFMCGTAGVGRLLILNRSKAHANALAADLGKAFENMRIEVHDIRDAEHIPADHFLAIQCTSVGLAPDTEASPVTAPSFFQKTSAAYDMIYNPETTRFLELCRESGTVCCNGADMLLWQAVAAFELWTGIHPPQGDVEAVRRSLLAQLRRQSGTKLRNIVLVGFMGSGKSRIGRELAKQTGCPQLDMDELIEKTAGMSISRIFSEEGEEGFRDRETHLLRTLVSQAQEGRIYSAGGGTVLRKENRQLLRSLGTVVLLSAAPETILERIGKDTSRPLLQAGNKLEKTKTMLRSRQEAYEDSADLTVQTDYRAPSMIADEILRRCSFFSCI